MELKYKSVTGFKVKADPTTQEMIISGWANVYNQVDTYGDMLTMGCAAKTLSEGFDRIAFLEQHDMDDPIGKILVLEEREQDGVQGLWIEVRISDAEPDIKTKITEGILKELSLGYCTLNGKIITMENGTQVWAETEIKIYEVSLVTRAANAGSVITSVKAEEVEQFNALIDHYYAKEKEEKKRFELLKLKAAISTQPSNTTEPDEQKSEGVDLEKVINHFKIS